MNLLDWFLVLVVVAYALSGYWQGFVTGAFATVGLLLGGALFWLGIRFASRELRLAALAVIGLTTLKVFLVDMSGLVGLLRVLSFLGLGLALIGLGAVYQRFVLPRSAPPAPQPPAGSQETRSSS